MSFYLVILFSPSASCNLPVTPVPRGASLGSSFFFQTIPWCNIMTFKTKKQEKNDLFLNYFYFTSKILIQRCIKSNTTINTCKFVRCIFFPFLPPGKPRYQRARLPFSLHKACYFLASSLQTQAKYKAYNNRITITLYSLHVI